MSSSFRTFTCVLRSQQYMSMREPYYNISSTCASILSRVSHSRRVFHPLRVNAQLSFVQVSIATALQLYLPYASSHNACVRTSINLCVSINPQQLAHVPSYTVTNFSGYSTRSKSNAKKSLNHLSLRG